jgi:CheY-like chemotaxis protein
MAAAAEDFDLVLSDIGTPIKNGYEYMMALRNSNRNTEAPAIAFTRYGRGQIQLQRCGLRVW